MKTPSLSILKTTPRPLVLALGAVFVLGGCSGMAANNPALDKAHASLRTLQGDPQARLLAPAESIQADEAVRAADVAWAQRGKADNVDHLAYLAEQRITIAREVAGTRSAEQSIVKIKADAEAAQASAVAAKTATDQARIQRELATERSQNRVDMAMARQDSQQQRSQLAAATVGAQQANARADDLTAQLVDLNAKQTQRGDVVTMRDVLFDSNRAELRAEGPDMGKLVAFLQKHPQRKAVIEGYTDSQGAADANVGLSKRRADAVRAVLVAQGIGAERLDTRGYGEAHPASTNDTAAGRQMNRRVEVVLSGDDGVVRDR